MQENNQTNSVTAASLLQSVCDTSNFPLRQPKEGLLQTNSQIKIEELWNKRVAALPQMKQRDIIRKVEPKDVRFGAEAFGLDFSVRGVSPAYFATTRVLEDDGSLYGFLVIRLPDLKNMGVVPAQACMSGPMRVANLIYNKHGKITPIHGALTSYPSVSRVDGTSINARALVVLGEAIIPKADVMQMKWDKKGASYFENVKEDKRVFFVIDAFGRINCIDYSEAVHLHTHYTFANAQMYGATLHSKNSCSVGIASFLPTLCCFKDNEKLRNSSKLLARNAKARPQEPTVASDMVTLDAKTAKKIAYLLDIAHLYRSVAGDVPTYQVEQYHHGAIIKGNRPALKTEQEKNAFEAAYLCDMMKVSPKQMVYIEREGSQARIWGTLHKDALAELLRIYDNLDCSCADLMDFMELKGTSISASACLEKLLDDCEPAQRVNQLRIYKNLPEDLRSYYDLCLSHESQITSHMQSVARKLGGTLMSIDNRVKMPASYAEKMLERSRLAGKDEKYELKWARDVIRYTILLDEQNYVEAIRKMMLLQYMAYYTPDALNGAKQRKWVIFDLRNFWTVATNPYNGTNTGFALFGSSAHNIKDEEADIYSYEDMHFDVRYEVQFHTKKSLAVKEGEMHKLYESYRSATGTVPEKVALQKEMMSLSAATPKPWQITHLTSDSIVNAGWEVRARNPVDLEAPRRDSKEFANYDTNKNLAAQYGEAAGNLVKPKE